MSKGHWDNWRDAALVYTRPRVLGMTCLGFSAGLPYLLVFSTLSAWLQQQDVSRTLIGYFSWIGLTYSIKVFWAPVIDRLQLPLLTGWLGKRRAWMFVGQLGIMTGLLCMGSSQFDNQQLQIAVLAVCGLLVAFASATQDISIDAYRIEAVDVIYQGAMSATYVLGYRLSLLVAGAGAFYIAEFSSWNVAYLCMAALMSVGLLTTLCIDEPDHSGTPPPRPLLNKGEPHQVKWLLLAFYRAVLGPLVEFYTRNGRLAIVILLLIGLYRLSDITMGVMANPFYLDIGFSLTEIAEVSKIFGFFMTIIGSILGGLLVVRFGVMGPLLLGAVMAAITNLLFALLAVNDPIISLLALAISADNLTGGIATSAFMAFLSAQINQTYTASQYALFSSLMTLPAKFLGGFSGMIVDTQGYEFFFVYTAVIGVPAMLLVAYLIRKQFLQAS